ncbi:alanine racemase [Microbacterium sp. cx-59]|uniref:alanine racemase n=1 Tax=Microbacterium sp. cx-59 TaxID=2891207 RepID=UPI001E339163|nr:alanine racemase [Microbacterium sp. cx-59]MCC4907293.1 alanine racemase [Microbacterium sp. cx-59]
MTAILTVDLDAFARNLRVVRDRVAPAELMLVVKDDAYGLGLDEIVTAAVTHGVRWIGAFDVASGERVRRRVGADTRIFAWRVSGLPDARAGIAAHLDLGIGDALGLEDVVSAAREADVVPRVHLKIDTGLHRNGVRPEDWATFVGRAAQCANEGIIEIAGIWSHIAEASDAEDDAARRLFEDALDTARAAGIAHPVRHLSASAASFARPEFRYDVVRVGAFCFGIRSAGGPHEAELGLVPVAALDATVIEVNDDEIVIDIGSSDGLPSSLAGRFPVRTPAGARRMTGIGDLTSTVEPWGEAQPGDVVRIYGEGASSPTDLAETIGSIGEEIALRLSPLVERRYL